MGPAGRVVVIQAALGLLCAALFFLMSTASARSALLALAASIGPCAYYAWVGTRTYSAARLLFHGVLKTILTAVLMAVAIVMLTIEPIGFFVTFAVMQLSYLAQPK